MKPNRAILLVAAILILGLVGSIILRNQTAPSMEDDARDEDTPSGDTSGQQSGTDTETSSDEPSSEDSDDEPSCIEIPPGISRDYDIIRIEGVVNKSIALDAKEIFGVTAEDYLWSQRFAGMEDLQYMSNFEMSINGSTNSTAYVNVTYPGVYRVELVADNASYEMELKATKIGKTIEMKGINFIDLFGTTGGPEFNLYPDDPECLQKALDHALIGPRRAGIEWIGFVSGGFYSQVDPPIIQDDDHFLSMSDEYFYGEFVKAAHSQGFKVIETFQDGPSVYFTPEQHEELAEKLQTAEWWDHWYEEWEVFMLRRLEMAERHGVDAVVLMMYVENTLDPVLVPDCAEKWIDMIDSLRGVYSGEIGLNFINLDERFTFYEEIDFIQITYFGGLWTSRQGAFADRHNPTMEEIMAVNDVMFEGVGLYDTKGVPIYAVLTIGSTDAQLVTEDPAQRSATDFNEQVLYYEAFYASLDKYDWVRGIITERWDYWDEYRRVGEAHDIQYYDETNAASPRNKPAEDVVALWNEVHQSP